MINNVEVEFDGSYNDKDYRCNYYVSEENKPLVNDLFKSEETVFDGFFNELKEAPLNTWITVNDYFDIGSKIAVFVEINTAMMEVVETENNRFYYSEHRFIPFGSCSDDATYFNSCDYSEPITT